MGPAADPILRIALIGMVGVIVFTVSLFAAALFAKEGKRRWRESKRAILEPWLLSLLTGIEGAGAAGVPILLLVLDIKGVSVDTPPYNNLGAVVAGAVIAAILTLPWLYLAFVALRFPNIGWRLLSRPRTTFVLIGVGFLLPFGVPLGLWEWDDESWAVLSLIFAVSVGIYALTLSGIAWVREEGAARRQARAFFTAFLVRDALWITTGVAIFLAEGGFVESLDVDSILAVIAAYVWPLAVLLFLILLYRGIYRDRFLGLPAALARSGMTVTVLVTGSLVFTVTGRIADDALGAVLGSAVGLAVGIVLYRYRRNATSIAVWLLGGERGAAPLTTDLYPVGSKRKV